MKTLADIMLYCARHCYSVQFNETSPVVLSIRARDEQGLEGLEEAYAGALDEDGRGEVVALSPNLLLQNCIDVTVSRHVPGYIQYMRMPTPREGLHDEPFLAHVLERAITLLERTYGKPEGE